MPTTAKAFSFLALGALAWVISRILLEPALPEGVAPGHMTPIASAIAAVIGWRVIGGRVGHGYGAVAGMGMTAAVLIVLAPLAVFSAYRMYEKSFQNRYKNLVDAALDVFAIGYDYLSEIMSYEAAFAVLGGCVAVSLMAEWVSKHTR